MYLPDPKVFEKELPKMNIDQLDQVGIILATQLVQLCTKELRNDEEYPETEITHSLFKAVDHESSLRMKINAV